jgi:hypothetical protein
MEATVKGHSNGEHNERFCGYIAKLPLDRWAIRAETPVGWQIDIIFCYATLRSDVALDDGLSANHETIFFVDFAYDGLTWL